MKKKLKRISGINWKVLILSLVIVYSVAFLGSLFTSPGINSGWYETIKPSITPPAWVFPVVWNTLFLLIALSLYFAWTNAKNRKDKKKIAIVFSANLLFNLLWSFLFFTLRSPAAAFFELIILLLPSIIAMILATKKINKPSSYLLIPYFIWVAFASILNYLSITQLFNLL
jgi:tryptophan-rich sensory protein